MIADGEGPCEMCESEGFECKRIHEPEYERIDLDTILYGPDRNFVQCDSCIAAKKKCSLKSKSDKPPCKQCKKGCTFYHGQSTASKKRKRTVKTYKRAPQSQFFGSSVYVPDKSFFSARDLESMDDSNTDDVDMNSDKESTPQKDMIVTDLWGRKGKVIEIDTCFAHPITFCMDEKRDDCDFCRVPVFSFIGNYETHVHVSAWFNGKGYTELGSGHFESRSTGTIMCRDCCFSRLQVVACPGHDIQEWENKSPDQDFNIEIQDLIEAAPDQFGDQLQRWCSFCMNLAKYRCCCPQDSGLDDRQLEGCGLSLCDRCEQELRQNFNGNCDLMATVLDKEPKAKAGSDASPVGVVRADVGFLREGGQLWKHVSDD